MRNAVLCVWAHAPHATPAGPHPSPETAPPAVKLWDTEIYSVYAQKKMIFMVRCVRVGLNAQQDSNPAAPEWEGAHEMNSGRQKTVLKLGGAESHFKLSRWDCCFQKKCCEKMEKWGSNSIQCIFFMSHFHNTYYIIIQNTFFHLRSHIGHNAAPDNFWEFIKLKNSDGVPLNFRIAKIRRHFIPFHPQEGQPEGHHFVHWQCPLEGTLLRWKGTLDVHHLLSTEHTFAALLQTFAYMWLHQQAAGISETLCLGWMLSILLVQNLTEIIGACWMRTDTCPDILYYLQYVLSEKNLTQSWIQTT